MHIPSDVILLGPLILMIPVKANIELKLLGKSTEAPSSWLIHLLTTHLATII